MPDLGDVRRPEAKVLREASLIPPDNLVRPPPNRFTHRVVEATPFFYATWAPGASGDGVFPAGTRVVVLVDDGLRCRVVDGHGLYVEVASSSLARLRVRSRPPA